MAHTRQQAARPVVWRNRQQRTEDRRHARGGVHDEVRDAGEWDEERTPGVVRAVAVRREYVDDVDVEPRDGARGDVRGEARPAGRQRGRRRWELEEGDVRDVWSRQAAFEQGEC